MIDNVKNTHRRPPPANYQEYLKTIPIRDLCDQKKAREGNGLFAIASALFELADVHDHIGEEQRLASKVEIDHRP